MTEVFDIAATSRGAGTFLLVISAVVALATVGVFGYIGMTMNHMFIQTDVDTVKVRIPMYTRTIKKTDILVDQVRVVDMNSSNAPRLGMRTNGIGMPGLLGGWYRLQGGGKVLAAITDRTSVMVIPTSLGYDIMASVKNPDALIAALRRR
ncbi:hypothetical protein KBA39_07385 [Myxococcota bacterium]|nr:hypothetical protein [Myxococcota bacterium]